MDIDLCIRFIFIGFGVLALVTVLELSTHIIRDKLGLDKEYYIVVYKKDSEEEVVFKTNDIKIDIATKVLKFKDCDTGKVIKMKEDYTYIEVSKNEWLSTDNTI